MFSLSVIPASHISASEVVLEEFKDEDRQKSDKDARPEASIKEKAELLGLGADIRVVMRGIDFQGQSLAYMGIIEENSADQLKPKIGNEIRPLDYGQIKELNFYTNRYKTQEQVDPDVVRRVADNIGIGQKVKIKLASDTKISGTIQSIEEEGFVVASNGKLVPVKYAEVKEIKKKKFPAWGKAAIAVGAVVVLLFAQMYASCGSGGCH